MHSFMVRHSDVWTIIQIWTTQTHIYTKLVEQEETPGVQINKKNQCVFIRRGTATEGFPWTSLWNLALRKRHKRWKRTLGFVTIFDGLERWKICSLVNMCDCSDSVNLLSVMHHHPGRRWWRHTVRACASAFCKISLCLAQLFVSVMRWSLEGRSEIPEASAVVCKGLSDVTNPSIITH